MNYNYDYSYDVNYLQKTFENNTNYQYDFCRVFLCKNDYDMKYTIQIQDSILDKFKDNTKLKKILQEGIDNGFNLPFALDEKTCFTLLFNYEYFYYIHKCIQDLFKQQDISDENFSST